MSDRVNVDAGRNHHRTNDGFAVDQRTRNVPWLAGVLNSTEAVRLLRDQIPFLQLDV
jgi:hypothetical protein